MTDEPARPRPSSSADVSPTRAATKPHLQVLIVEDSALDAELIVRELRRDYDTEWERVETADAMREALSRSWDLICSDWLMPHFNAMAAFDVLREARLDIPFIIISGTIGEETAVAAMRAGVQDFMVKGSLPRLLPAVQRELREASHRQEQRKMHRQLAMSDRLASVGMLAAGIAHEINNPLAALVTNIEAAQETLTAIVSTVARAGGMVEAERNAVPGLMVLLERHQAALADAAVATERIGNTAQDLKLFAKSDPEETSAVDVRQVLASTARMAATATRCCARVVHDFGDIPPILANEGRISQVFLNLILNAAQAIPEGNVAGNEIRLVTRFDAARGRVVVEVHDTGSGIPEAILPRIFDPFFTTKPIGIGTGLGLAICHRIVSALDGRMDVRTTEGKGSTFIVELPAMKPEDAPVRRRPRRRPASDVVAARRGRVLVVDDDAIVASAVARALERDHEVVPLQLSEEALRRVIAGERFDAILCDLMMPQITGMQLYECIREVAPDQARRMVFLTGGAFTAEARSFLDRVPNTWIEKPFQSDRLRAVVNEVVVGDGPHAELQSASV